MLRGYRHIVFALVGFLTLAAHHPNAEAKGKQSDPQERSAHALENIASRYEEQTKRPQSSRETEQCDQANDKRYSDLCAQWKAADAAADSAWWAAVGGFAGAVSTILVLIALYFAFRSNWIARDTAKRQLRAYVGPEVADISLIVGSIPPQARLNINSRNVGQTPAQAMHTRVEYFFADRGWRGEWSISRPESGHTVTVLFPTCATELKDAIVELGEYDRWVAGELDLFIFSEVDYRDIFDEPHSTKSRWVVKGDQPLVMKIEDIGNSAT